MAIPTQKQLHRPVLEILEQANAVVSAREVFNRIAKRLSLSDEELQQRTASGPPTANNRTLWAVSYLRAAGLVANVARGQLYITDAGRSFLKTHPGEIDTGILKRLANPELPDGEPPIAVLEADTSPDELMDKAYGELHIRLTDELLDGMGGGSSGRFERLCVHLLEAMGYGKGIHLGQTGDGGVDGLIRQDALGLEKIYIQAKRWTNQIVGPDSIRDFSGSLDAKGAAKGVFITTSSFSDSAKSTAESISQGAKEIILINGRELATLMITYGVGVVTEKAYEIKKLDENYFAEEQ